MNIREKTNNGGRSISGDSLVKNFGIEAKVKSSPAVADGLQYDERPTIEFNDLPIDWLAKAIADAVDATSFKEIQTFVTDEDLEGTGIENNVEALVTASFKVALGARLADVNNLKCLTGRKNFEFPSLIGPVIAAYGRVENNDIGLTIWPTPSDALTKDLVKMDCYTVKNRDDEALCFEEVQSFKMPAWYQKFMRFYRTYKLLTAYGLPMDKIIADDMIYRVTTVNTTEHTTDNRLVGREPRITPDVQLISTIVRAASLANIFGQYRVEYCAISSMRSAIEDIALKAIHLNANRDV